MRIFYPIEFIFTWFVETADLRLLVDDEINVHVGVYKVPVRGPAHRALDPHQAVLLRPAEHSAGVRDRPVLVPGDFGFKSYLLTKPPVGNRLCGQSSRRPSMNIVKISRKFIDISIPDVSIHGDRLVTVCVPKDDVWDPELANLTTFIEYLLNCHFAFCKT